MSFSEAEARIRRLMSRLKDAEYRASNVQDRILRDRQNLMGFYQVGAGSRFDASIEGLVNGCSLYGFDGAQVVIKDHGTGKVLATLDADVDGNYSTSLSFNGSPPRLVDVVATPTGIYASRFNGPVALSSIAISKGPNTIATETLLPATNFCCSDENYYPDPISVVACVTVTNSCNSTAVSGATVTFSKTGQTSVVDTTDGSGEACGTLAIAGTWNYSVSKSGFSGGTGTVSVSCGSSPTATKAITPTTGSIKIQLFGNCQAPIALLGFAIPGATVEAKQGGVTVASGVTDSSGICILTGIPLSVSTTVTAANSDYSTQTSSTSGVLVTNACTQVNLGAKTVPLDANWHCIGWTGGTPSLCLTGNEIQMTTPWGDCVGTWDPTKGNSPPAGAWVGILPGVTLPCADDSAGRVCPPNEVVDITVMYYADSTWGFGWGISAPRCTPTIFRGGFFPNGGGHAVSNFGSCDPLYSWATFVYHSGPFGNAGLMLCPDPLDEVFTFSFSEITP